MFAPPPIAFPLADQSRFAGIIGRRKQDLIGHSIRHMGDSQLGNFWDWTPSGVLRNHRRKHRDKGKEHRANNSWLKKSDTVN